VGVKGEKKDEALAYAASSAEDTYETILLTIGLANGTTLSLTCPASRVDSLTAPLLGKVGGLGSEVFGFHFECDMKFVLGKRKAVRQWLRYW
jgi:hypothetical protein